MRGLVGRAPTLASSRRLAMLPGPKPRVGSRWIGHWQQGGLLGRSSVGALNGRTLHSGAKLQLAPQSKHRVTLHSIGTKNAAGCSGRRLCRQAHIGSLRPQRPVSDTNSSSISIYCLSWLAHRRASQGGLAAAGSIHRSVVTFLLSARPVDFVQHELRLPMWPTAASTHQR
jgi:hypothetical protein